MNWDLRNEFQPFSAGTETRGLGFSRETDRIFRGIHEKDLLEKMIILMWRPSSLKIRWVNPRGKRKLVVWFSISLWAQKSATGAEALCWRWNVQKSKEKGCCFHESYKAWISEIWEQEEGTCSLQQPLCSIWAEAWWMMPEHIKGRSAPLSPPHFSELNYLKQSPNYLGFTFIYRLSAYWSIKNKFFMSHLRIPQPSQVDMPKLPCKNLGCLTFCWSDWTCVSVLGQTMPEARSLSVLKWELVLCFPLNLLQGVCWGSPLHLLKK